MSIRPRSFDKILGSDKPHVPTGTTTELGRFSIGNSVHRVAADPGQVELDFVLKRMAELSPPPETTNFRLLK